MDIDRLRDCSVQEEGSKYRTPNKLSCKLHEKTAHAFLVLVVVVFVAFQLVMRVFV